MGSWKAATAKISAPAASTTAVKGAPVKAPGRNVMAKMFAAIDNGQVSIARDPMLKPRIVARSDGPAEGNIAQAGSMTYACEILAVEFVDDQSVYTKFKFKVVGYVTDPGDAEVTGIGEDAVTLHYFDQRYPSYWGNDMASFVCAVDNCPPGSGSERFDAMSGPEQVVTGQLVAVTAKHKGKYQDKKSGEDRDSFKFFFDPCETKEDGTFGPPEVDNRK